MEKQASLLVSSLAVDLQVKARMMARLMGEQRLTSKTFVSTIMSSFTESIILLARPDVVFSSCL
jgi:hypothetical protein